MTNIPTKGKYLLLTLFGLLILPLILFVIVQITVYSKLPAPSTFSAPVMYLILMVFTYHGKMWAKTTLSAFLVFAMIICIMVPFFSAFKGAFSEFLLVAAFFFANGLVVYQLNTNKNIDAYFLEKKQ